MSHRKLMFGLTLSAAVGFGAAYLPAKVHAQAAKPAAPAPAAAAPTCKLHGKKCCDPAIMAHLPKDAVFKACGQSEATFLGEDGHESSTCTYFFKVAGEKEDETYVQVYAPTQKEVLAAPNDPFFSYKKVGKAFMADKAKSPKSAPMLVSRTGLYMPAKGYSVTVNASTKVCTKEQAKKLAPAMN